MQNAAAFGLPELRVDEARWNRNLERIADYAAAHELRVRPTLKTHRSRSLAQLQLEKLGTSAVELARASDSLCLPSDAKLDISFGYPFASEEAARAAAAAVSPQVPRFVVTRAEHCEILEQVARSCGAVFPCFVAYDLCCDRFGVMSRGELVERTRSLTESAHLSFCGLHLYAGSGASTDCPPGEAPELLLEAAVTSLRELNLEPEIVSFASSTLLYRAHTFPGVNEVRVGGAFFYDAFYAAHGVCGVEDCAVTVRAHVLDRCRSGYVIDVGSKLIGAKPITVNGSPCFGMTAAEHGELIIRCNEECSILASSAHYPIGAALDIIPANASLAMSQFGRFTLLRTDGSREYHGVGTDPANF